jgi:hypothetical protein
MPPTIISQDELIAGIISEPGIQSATWARKSDKFVTRCSNCNSEAAKIRKDWFCNNCDAFVNVWRDKVASKGDDVTLQFRRHLNHEGTKNWQPAGGFAFNAATREQAERIKAEKGLLQVCKMSETGTDDLRATPRMIPLYLVTAWKAGGVEYQVR